MVRLAPICVMCRVEMRCIRNEIVVKDRPTADHPSSYWNGDQYACPNCGYEIITGFGVSASEARMKQWGSVTEAIVIDRDVPKEESK